MTSLKNGMHEDEWLKGLWLFEKVLAPIFFFFFENESLAPFETTLKESLPPSKTNHMSTYTKDYSSINAQMRITSINL